MTDTKTSFMYGACIYDAAEILFQMDRRTRRFWELDDWEKIGIVGFKHSAVLRSKPKNWRKIQINWRSPDSKDSNF